MRGNKKIVAVTGASRGIGRGISLMLAENGCVIIAVGVRNQSDPNVSGYIKELTNRSPESIYISADISKDSDCDNIIDIIKNKFNYIDFHVNNAGVAPLVRNDILETTRESFDRVLDINLKGAFFLTQKIANFMVKNPPASQTLRGIINISSVSAYTSSTNRAEYCISKAGVSMITTLFADRLAEYNINVYEIRPGIIETDMTAGVLDKYNKLIEGGLTPVRRLGRPEDIAKPVLAIISGLLPYSTGEIINADGGFHLKRL
ncbi:MAG: 3-ketoacyl-ACP reductase [Oscillospiraceae bacterium]|nr:3-ketoacyl-ACP reductase [Oscillospiraceae bacterium]